MTELEVPETMHIEPEAKAETLADPRKEIMDQIYAKRQKQLADEMGLESPEPEKIEEKPEEPEPEKEPEPAEEPKAEEKPEVKTEAKAEEKLPNKIPLKVNGKPLEIDTDELITLAQKGLAAEQKFQEAARMRDEAQKLMFQNQPQNQAQNQAQNTPNTPPAGVIDDATAKELVRRINYGSEEEQAKAIRDLAALTANQGRQMPTPDEIVNVATRNALVQLQFQNDMATIGKEYPDIFNDEPLSMAAGIVAKNLVAKNQALGVQKPALEVWREACQQTREKYIRPEPQTPPVQAATILPMKEKLERKRAAPQPPAAASKVAMVNPPPEVTPSTIVQQMRKSRGQPTY